MVEWDNKVNIKGFDEPVPLLDAGYDKFYWYNKLGGQSGGVTMNSPRLEKEQG